MLDFLINSEVDVTLLTCKACAVDIYEDLIAMDCRFIQSEQAVLKEIERCNDVVEITKLVAESNEKDAFFVLGMEDEKDLTDRVVVIDSCVYDYVDEYSIPENSEVIIAEYDEADLDIVSDMSDFIKLFTDNNDCCECDECLAVGEIIENEELSFEEALREAYRAGKIAALTEIAEEIENKIFE